MKVKLFHKKNCGAWILCGLMFLVALAAYPALPEQIPLHFNAAGAVDRTGPRYTVFLMPGFTAVLLLLAEALPGIDPRRANYRKFRRQYRQVHFITALLLLLAELYTIAVCFRPELTETFSMAVWMPAVVGAFLAFCGNVMPKFKHNYFVGVKTPWTLADEKVWYLTHRFCGKLYMAGGVLMMLMAFLPSLSGYTTLALLLFLIFLPILYSYLAFRRIRKDADPSEEE